MLFLNLLPFPTITYRPRLEQPLPNSLLNLGLASVCALSTAVHTVAAQHTFSMLQVVDEEPLLARWNGEIHQDIIICAIPSSLAIVSYLREILAIHLAIPFLAIDVILIQWLSVPVINGRHKRNANNQQHYDNQQYDIYLVLCLHIV